MKKIILLILTISLYEYILAQNDSLETMNIFKQFYYPNGNISSEGYLKDDNPVGFWKSYYITGVKKSEGKWLNKKLDSTWIFYDQVGDTTEKINYYHGQKNGYQYKFYKSDNNKNRLYSRELYVNGQRNNMAYYYYENGNIKREVPYLNDKKQGLGFEYDINDNIISIIRYRNNEIIEQENINHYNSEGEKDGIWRNYYENGNIKDEKIYLNGKLNGYYKLYNEEGKLIEAIKYKSGELDLESKDFETNIEIKEEYDENENLIFQGSYKNNIPIGIHRFFNNKGKVIKSTTYDINGNKIAEGKVLMNGNEDGEWVYYYENRNKNAVGTYNNGNKTGKWTYYYPNERIKQTGTYNNGKFSGAWKWYYSTGEILKEENYIYGKLEGEITEFSESGDTISKGNYIEGYKEGEWLYQIGDQKLIGNYVMDLKDGDWKSYYINNKKISFEGRYIQGNEDGKHIYYYTNGKIKEERYYDEGIKVKSWSKYNEQGELIIVIQFKEGKEYKINGIKVNIDKNDN